MKKKLLSLLLAVVLVVSIPGAQAFAASANVTKVCTNDKKLNTMIKDAGPWWMLTILYDHAKTVSLTKNAKIQMAAYAAVNNQKYTYNEAGNNGIMTKNNFEKAYSDLFGYKTSIKNIRTGNTPKKPSGIIYRKGNKLFVNLGDWGEAGPVFKITKVSKIGHTYKAKVNMYFAGANTKTKLKATATMYFVKNAKSSYGYKITSLIVKATKK